MNEQKNKMSKKHMILMILGCAVPIIVISVLFILGIPLNNILLFGLILICPLSHIFMMKFMMNHGNDTHLDHAHETLEDLQKRY